jgi:hypothetical protein
MYTVHMYLYYLNECKYTFVDMHTRETVALQMEEEQTCIYIDYDYEYKFMNIHLWIYI